MDFFSDICYTNYRLCADQHAGYKWLGRKFSADQYAGYKWLGCKSPVSGDFFYKCAELKIFCSRMTFTLQKIQLTLKITY